MKQYLERIIGSKQKLFTKAEKIYADYFLELGEDLLNKTISNLAKEIDSSTASIFKFVKKLGFEGFRDFQISLASQIKLDEDDSLLTAITTINDHDSPQEIGKKVTLFNIQYLHTLLEELENIPLEEILDLIKDKTELHFFGIGGSSIIAYDCYHKFLRTSYRVNYIQDSHMQISYATKLDEKDLVFAFSHSGESLEPIQLAKEVKKRNASLVVLTGNPKSKLLDLADISIVLPTLESTFRSESLSSRFSYLTVMDIIFVALIHQDPEANKQVIKDIRNVVSTKKLK